ncbi:hypothetical protein FZ103_10750 [Streptomonospora sp. PA3]|uniref:DUF6221 family protein n=1 Tax=Streptomonospora sp. PA3 TaxID=2607326 RepID=UPI0012DEAA09|nr:hypothetical protein [Streptomonospora sp. PA3]
MSIVDFLFRRLDEDETTARRAADYRSRPGGGEGVSGYERWVWVDAATGERPPRNLHQDMLRVENGALLRSEQEYPMQSAMGTSPGHVLHVRNGHLTVKQAVADHIVRHDPVHVVADIDAKRRMVAAHTPTGGASRGDPTCPKCVTWQEGTAVPEPFPCFTLLLLAQPYGDHPEHDPEWQNRLQRWPLVDPMQALLERFEGPGSPEGGSESPS